MSGESKKKVDGLIIGQCAMCGGPVSEKSATRDGRQNLFCCESCLNKFAAFADLMVKTAKSPAPPFRFRYWLKTFIRRLVIVLLFLIILGAVTLHYDVPIFGPFFQRLLDILGF